MYFVFLISNTLPHLEPSSLQPSSVLHHRHLLQTTCYNHLLLLLISRKENRSKNRLRNPLSTGLRRQKALRPFNPLQHIDKTSIWNQVILLPKRIKKHHHMMNIFPWILVLIRLIVSKDKLRISSHHPLRLSGTWILLGRLNKMSPSSIILLNRVHWPPYTARLITSSWFSHSSALSCILLMQLFNFQVWNIQT